MTSIKPDLVVAVVGLGYVGLPLAVEFGKKYRTIGYDLSQAKIDAYRQHADPTGELSTVELKAATGLAVTTDPSQLKSARSEERRVGKECRTRRAADESKTTQ